MHRMARLVATSVALSTVALACAGGGVGPADGYVPTTRAPATTTTAPPTLDPDVVIGIASAGAPRTLNPLLDSPDTAVLDIIAPAVFASAYDVDPVTFDLIADVVAEIPSLENGGMVVGEDGTVTVTYRVAPGAAGADGTPITGSDLLFTYELVSDLTLPIRPDVRALYSPIIPGTAAAEGPRMQFQAAPGPRLDRLFEVIVPRHKVEGTDFAADWNERMWVAGGPFGYSGYEAGQFLELRANPNYWKPGPGGTSLPNLERLVFRFYDVDGGAVDSRVLTGFETEGLDVIMIADAGGVQTRLSSLEDLGASVVVAPGPEWEHLNFQFGPNNRNDETLNEHREFRRAVAHAIDRQRLSELSGTPPVTSIVQLFDPQLESVGWTGYAADIEEVKGQLFELEQQIDEDLFAGNGPRLVVSAERDDLAIAALAGEVVRMLDEAGIGAELQLEDEAVLFGDTLDDGSWDAGVWAFSGGAGLGDAAAFMAIFDPDGLPYVGSNFFRWGTIDSSVDDEATDRYASLVDELRRTVDPKRIAELVVEAESILADEVVIVPLVYRRLDAMAWWGADLEGPIVNPRQSLLWNVEEWRRPRQ